MNQNLQMSREQMDLVLKAVRADIIRMASRSAHVGPSLSCADIIAAVYFLLMKPSGPAIPNDRFILSKGHGCMALYAVLAAAGRLDKTLLDGYAQDGSLLAEHPPAGAAQSGIELATGSLGHGSAVAAGIAYAKKLKQEPGQIFVLLGDGECDEGSVWESAALASSLRLGNLTALIDCNGVQACDACTNISPAVSLESAWRAFGWDTVRADGHNPFEIRDAAGTRPADGPPLAVLCRTLKGKGIPFMEGDLEWHYRPVQGDWQTKALEHLGHA